MCGGRSFKACLIIVFLLGILCTAAAGRTIYVDNVGSADFSTIQAAINYANDGDTIVVADGTYTGDGNRDIDFLGKAITLRSKNGPENCIIDCNGTEAEPHRGFLFYNGEDSNSILDGFTIRNGYDPVSGGGILCSSVRGLVSPTIQNCIITNNRARDDGGGIMCSVASPIIRNCIITKNVAEVWWGGGMHCRSCTGAILDNCLITENSAREGGGISSSGDNFLPPGDVIVTNCTFSGNSAACGGAVCVNDGSQPSMLNCILWGDTAMYGPEIALAGFWPVPFLHVSFSDVQGGEADVYGHRLYWEAGNIDADPCFADVQNDDYHLKSQAGRWEPNLNDWVTDANTSPCIDAGNPGCLPGSEPAPSGNRINMGAFGGIEEASKSPANWRSIADITNDWIVDVNDLKVFVNYWLDGGHCIPGDLNRNLFVDFVDFALLANNWLQTSFVENIFDYGVATRGALNLMGNIEIGGASIFIDASVYIESLNDANALHIIGNSHIASDVFIINPDATVTLQGGQASIGGETGQDAIDNHVNFGTPSTEFPVPEPNYFRHYVQNTYDPNNVLMEYDNVIIPAGTNPLFGTVTFRGVVFIEAHNIVRFCGNTEITGIIVGNGDLNDDSGTNQILFTGTISSYPVTDLPAEPQFEQLRDETGTFLMAPGFKAIFWGNFDTLNGAIAANGIEFGGNAGGTIDGSIINYSDEPMTITGNSDLFFNRSGTAQMPAGFD